MPLPGDLTTITVTASYPNVAGQPQSGHVTFDPGAVLADSTGKVILTGAVRCEVYNDVMQPAVLPCTDNAGLNPTGFAYTVTEVIGTATRSYQVQLPHTLGSTVDLSSLSPVTSPPAATAFASNNTWTGTQTFSGNPPVDIPAGAVNGYVLTSDGSGNASWQPSAGGGSNPMTAVGDTIYGGTAGVQTRLPAQTSATKKFLTETGTGSAGQAPAWSVISAGDVPTLNQNTTGTASNVTATLDQIPAPAANVALNSKKLTGLANGTVASDAAAFGQVPTSAGAIGGLLAASNLSDVASAATARVNLGLGAEILPADEGFFGWAYDPAICSNASNQPPAGTVIAIRVKVPACTISNLWVGINSPGSGLTSGQNFAGLYSGDGSTLLSATADQSSAWTSGFTSIQMALTTPQAVSAGWVYVAWYSNGTTIPKFQFAGSANVVNANLSNATARFARGGTGRTTSLPSSLTLSTASDAYWTAVS